MIVTKSFNVITILTFPLINFISRLVQQPSLSSALAQGSSGGFSRIPCWAHVGEAVIVTSTKIGWKICGQSRSCNTHILGLSSLPWAGQHTMQTLEFITVTGADIAGDDAPRASTTNRHRIRSHAMRDFRRRERQERITGTSDVVSETSDESQSDHKKNEVARSKTKVKALRTMRPPVAVSTSKVWRHLFAQKLTEAWFPPGYRGAALDNIAYTYDVLSSAPIATIQDTLSMLNAGSTAKMDRLLLEARKRYLATIVLLRQHASGKASNMPIIMLGYLAMACLMCEVNMTLPNPFYEPSTGCSRPSCIWTR